MNGFYRVMVMMGVLVFGMAMVVEAQLVPYTPSAGGGASASGASSADGSGGTTASSPSTGGGNGAQAGESAESGGGGASPAQDTSTQSDDNQNSNAAEIFRVTVKKLKSKINNGVSVFWQDPRGDIRRFFFGGSVLGSNWRISGAITDPIAQGTLTGKGSILYTVIRLYTGSVTADFISRAVRWTASFYSDGESSRSELSNGAMMYQEEMWTDADGTTRNNALLLNGATLFGAYDGGTVLMVDRGASPDEAPAGVLNIPIPSANGSLLPTKTIIKLLRDAGIALRDMFVTVAHAVSPVVMPSKKFSQSMQGIKEYKKIKEAMRYIEEKFSMINFNSPNFYYDDAAQAEAQDLVDAYDINQAALDRLKFQLGPAWLFERDGNWAYEEGPAAASLMESGVDATPAILISKVSGPPFDFYTVQDADGKQKKQKVFAGSCEKESCVMRVVTAAQARAILTANDAYAVFMEKARISTRKIEEAFFALAE